MEYYNNIIYMCFLLCVFRVCSKKLKLAKQFASSAQRGGLQKKLGKVNPKIAVRKNLISELAGKSSTSKPAAESSASALSLSSNSQLPTVGATVSLFSTAEESRSSVTADQPAQPTDR